MSSTSRKQLSHIQRLQRQTNERMWEKLEQHTTTPMLISWAGHLSPEGKAVADWLNLIGAELPKPPDRSLLTPAQCYLRNLSDVERAALWSRFQAEGTEVVADV